MAYHDKIPSPELGKLSVREIKKYYEKHEPEMKALDSTKLDRIHVDIDGFVKRVMFAVNLLKSFWGQLVLLPDIAMGDLERLRELTLALLFVHGGLEQAAAKRRVLQTLVEEGFAVRAKLTTLVTLLVDAGKVPASVIEQLKGGTAYTAVANDIRSLVEALRLRWSEIGDSAFINKAQIDAAQLLSDRIYSNVLTEAGAGASADEFGTSDMRRRGFTLAKRLYVDIRRAAKYMLGRTHDVDALIEPLASTRPKRRVRPVVARDVAGDTGEQGSETEAVVEVGATEVATDSAETPTGEATETEVATEAPAATESTPAADETVDAPCIEVPVDSPS